MDVCILVHLDAVLVISAKVGAKVLDYEDKNVASIPSRVSTERFSVGQVEPKFLFKSHVQWTAMY